MPGRKIVEYNYNLRGKDKLLTDLSLNLPFLIKSFQTEHAGPNSGLKLDNK